MRNLTVISGKGGTGKTTIVTSFAALAKKQNAKIVLADCDVDAADLHILLRPEQKHREIFTGGMVAAINTEKCIGCGRCYDVCRFDAIIKKGNKYEVEPIACEGCGTCDYVCPKDAIVMSERESGYWSICDTSFGPLVNAKLAPGQGNSGKLVTIVRQAAEEIARTIGADYLIIDGSPGIGCPVIASITNTDMALLVVEPTLSGLHDMSRALGLCAHFGVPTAVCVNKYDLNLPITNEIESIASQENIPIVGKIPYDISFVESLTNLTPAVDYVTRGIRTMIESVWEKTKSMLDQTG